MDTNNGHGAPVNNSDLWSLWPIAVALFIGLILAAIGFMNYTPPNRDDNGTNKTVNMPTVDPMRRGTVHVSTTTPAPNNITTTGEIGPCATEDSDNCYRLFGGSDGVGRAFVNIGGTVYYLHG